MAIATYDIEDIESIDALNDVDNTNKADGKVLVFRSASGNMEYETPSGGGGGPDIKAGIATFNTDTWTSISFVTAFASTPKVVVTANQDSTARWDFTPIIRNVTVNGFDCPYDDRGQSGTTIISWIATDAGNP